jgi:hypothetical protein
MKSGSPGENGLDTIPSKKKMLVPPLLSQPLDELRQQQVQGGQGRREALRKTDRETRVGSLSIRDPFDLRIKHVNSKMAAFRRDLRIRGLRSIIRATVQKVNFLVNSRASFHI